MPNDQVGSKQSSKPSTQREGRSTSRHRPDVAKPVKNERSISKENHKNSTIADGRTNNAVRNKGLSGSSKEPHKSTIAKRNEGVSVERKPSVAPKTNSSRVTSNSQSRGAGDSNTQRNAVPIDKKVPSKKISTSQHIKDANVNSKRPTDQKAPSTDHKGPLKATRNGGSKSQVNGSMKTVKNGSSVLPSKGKIVTSNGRDREPRERVAENREQFRLSRERTRTRTISPDESKLMTTFQEAANNLPKDVGPARSGANEYSYERTSENQDADIDYEEDFEDYESDFEEMSTSESKSKENSGESEDDDGSSYENTEDKELKVDEPISVSNTDQNNAIHIERAPSIEVKNIPKNNLQSNTQICTQAEEMRKAMEIENAQLAPLEKPIKSSPAGMPVSVTTDRGFEANFINFAQAKKRQLEKRTSTKIKKRGEVLMSMIRLDSMGFSLFDMAPVPYEVYMRSYGRSNAQQAYSQTNDDCVNEEVQTDLITARNKWTQHPPALIMPSNTVTSYPRSCAVASDPAELDDLWGKSLRLNPERLEHFIMSAGQVVLNLLEESSAGARGLLRGNNVDLGFSQGFIMLNLQAIPFLSGRPVRLLRFLPHQSHSLLTVHSGDQADGEAGVNRKVSEIDEEAAECLSRCILCLWSVLRPSQPLRMLVSSADVSCLAFHPGRPGLLFTGLQDGLISVWNLKQRSSYNRMIQFEGSEWSLQSPAYTTADKAETKHSTAVVGIQVLDSVTDVPAEEAGSAPAQICSVDESGQIYVWTVLIGAEGSAIQDDADAGLAPWSRVRLLLNSTFSVSHHVNASTFPVLKDNLQCFGLELDAVDPAHLYLPTNNGFVVHCLKTSSRAHPAVYRPNSDSLASVTCVAPCPFGLPYFLVGCSDGSVRLHSRHSEKALLNMAGSGGALGYGEPITCIQWSNNRPCVFFVLDSTSRLHVWDLTSSDMYSLLEVPFKGRAVITMQLSPVGGSGKLCPYMALGTACGKVKVHLVKNEFASSSNKETALELDKFKRYVNIL